MIITSESHVDHSITPEQLAWIMEKFGDRKAFFIETLTLPKDLGTVPCGLYGPIMGDDPVPFESIRFEARGTRKWPSRLVRAPMRPTRMLSVIAGPDGDEPCVLYTAFGGPVSPREPGDTSLVGNAEGLAESEAFWAEHALVG